MEDQIGNISATHEMGAMVGPIRSPFPVAQRIRRLVWNIVWLCLFRPSPRVSFGWRRLLLMVFGARVHRDARVYASVHIWAPWNLRMGARSILADNVDCYNVDMVSLEDDAIVSQYSYLCTAGHNIDDPACPLITAPIILKRWSWVAAKTIVGMGVTVEEGGVVGMGAFAIKSVPAWTVVGGVPARETRRRKSFA